MAKYKVLVSETFTRPVVIKADCIGAAMDKAVEMVEQGELEIAGDCNSDWSVNAEYAELTK